MLLVKKIPVALKVSTLLSLETQGFASWNDSSKSFYNEWWYGDWTGLSNKGLGEQIPNEL